MKPLRFVLVVIMASGPILAAQVRVPPSQPLPVAQEPVPTFRAGVRAIQVDAVVTDADGNPVRGLTAEDF